MKTHLKTMLLMPTLTSTDSLIQPLINFVGIVPNSEAVSDVDLIDKQEIVIISLVLLFAMRSLYKLFKKE